MRLALYSSASYDERFFEQARKSYKNVEITYHTFPLTSSTADLSKNYDAVCVFVNDSLETPVLEALHSTGIKTILLRCAGVNNIDLDCATKLGITVANVPSYSPEGVAEFAVALVQTLNRKTHRSYMRVREGNFALEGLLGRTLHGKTIGVVGTGKIGRAFGRIMRGFGCEILGFDVKKSDFKDIGTYVELDELLRRSDVVSLHCPLVKGTQHLIDGGALAKMKDTALLVNTSRGALVDTTAVIRALKGKKLGGVALDVYEKEAELFFADHSSDVIQDDVFQRLLTFPNVIVTGHQSFFTEEALTEIAETTMHNLEAIVKGRECKNVLGGKK